MGPAYSHSSIMEPGKLSAAIMAVMVKEIGVLRRWTPMESTPSMDSALVMV